MNNQNFFGPIGGFILAAAAYVSPIGEIPFSIILALTGVKDPVLCWEAMKASSSVAYACAPYGDPVSLLLLSNLLVAGGIGVLAWVGISKMIKN